MATDPLRAVLAEIVQEQVQAALAPYADALNRLVQFMGAPQQQPLPFGRTVPRPYASMSSAQLEKMVNEPETITRRRGRTPRGAKKPCAIKGCGKDAKSLSLCSNHVQKYYALKKKSALPDAWKAIPNVAPDSLDNPKLPRGRAASKAKKGKK